MKKVLLIIAIVLCVFQIVVLATVIEMGNTVIDRDNVRTAVHTWIIKDSPAGASGKITTVKIWANAELAGCEVAIFTEGVANTFTTRDNEVVDNGNGVGVVLAGSEQTFTVDLDVITGDYIGFYWTDGSMEYDNDGDVWYLSGDQIPCTNAEFTALGRGLSLHGTGATIGIKWNTVTISKWNTKTLSSWNGM